MKLINFYTILFVFFFISCNKEAEFTLEGRIMIDCETPLSNAELEIYDANKNDLISTFKTDENGSFKASYPRIKTRVPGSLQKSPKVSILGDLNSDYSVYFPNISGNRNINLETLPILRVKKSFDVVLDVENPYNANYKLVLPDYTQPNPNAIPIEIVGPFTPGVVYSAQNVWIQRDIDKVDFTIPNGMDLLEVNYLFPYKIVGPTGTVNKNILQNFGLQCDTLGVQVVLSIN